MLKRVSSARASLTRTGLANQVSISGGGGILVRHEMAEQPGDLEDPVEEGRAIDEMKLDVRLRGAAVQQKQRGQRRGIQERHLAEI